MRSNPDFPQTGHRYYHRVTFSNSFLLSNNISRLRQLSIFIVLVVFHRSHRRKIKKQNLFSQWPISQRLYCWNYSFFFFFLSASYFCFLISFRANENEAQSCLCKFISDSIYNIYYIPLCEQNRDERDVL